MTYTIGFMSGAAIVWLAHAATTKITADLTEYNRRLAHDRRVTDLEQIISSPDPGRKAAETLTLIEHLERQRRNG